jgi:hypothetical protein
MTLVRLRPMQSRSPIMKEAERLRNFFLRKSVQIQRFSA